MCSTTAPASTCENRIVSFDIKELGKQLKKIGMLIVQDAGVEPRHHQPRGTQIHPLLSSTRCTFLLPRGADGGVHGGNLEALSVNGAAFPPVSRRTSKTCLSSREVENIFENSDYRVHAEPGRPATGRFSPKQLNISPHQLSYVTHSGEGEGLLFYGSTILPFVDHFPKDTELYRIITTKPQEQAG